MNKRLLQKDLHLVAQANADFFKVPYVCFFDTSMKYRCERYDPTLTCHREGGRVFQPREQS